MNATRSQSNLKSIRIGRVHYDVNSLRSTDFKTINKAKKHSRELGGAGFVRVARNHAEAEAIFREMTK